MPKSIAPLSGFSVLMILVAIFTHSTFGVLVVVVAMVIFMITTHPTDHP